MTASTRINRVGHSAPARASVAVMQATVMYGAGDVRIETVPDAHLIEPADAPARVTRACICGPLALQPAGTQ